MRLAAEEDRARQSHHQLAEATTAHAAEIERILREAQYGSRTSLDDQGKPDNSRQLRSRPTGRCVPVAPSTPLARSRERQRRARWR